MPEKTLPTIKSLFQEAWDLLIKNVFNMFLFALLGIVVSFGLFMVALVVLYFSGFNMSFFDSLSQGDLTVLTQPALIVALVSVIVVFTIISTVFQNAIYAGMTLLLDKNEKDQKILPLVKKGFRYVLPLIGLGLVYCFFMVGGFFFLILPAILFSFFFMFSFYELVTENKSILNSLRGSYQIVKSNFGEILIRILAFIFAYIALSVFIPNVIREIDETTGTILAFYSLIVNTLLGWYGLTYSLTLYKQAKKTTDFSQKSSLAWIVVMSILGWLILIPVSYGVKAAIHSDSFREGFQTGFNESFNKNKEYNTYGEKNAVISTTDGIEVTAYLAESQDYFDQMKNLQTQPDAIEEIKAVNDKNIDLLLEATEKFPQNPKIWIALGNAYTWASNKGNLDDGLAAMQKAAELDPDNDIALGGIGLFYSRMGEFDKAIVEYQKALRIRETNATTHQQMGDAYAQLKIYDSAREHYDRAIELFEKSNSTGTFDSTILYIQKARASLPQ